MALDLVEERRSAGRRIQPELWLCLGATSDPRGLPALEAELAGQDELGRKAAVLALGRLGATDRLEEIRREGGSVLGPVAESALMGRHDQPLVPFHRRTVCIPQRPLRMFRPPPPVINTQHV